MRGTPTRFVDFTGGLNTNDSPYLVAQNECRDCLNVQTTTRGSVRRRGGNQTVNSTNFSGISGDIQSLWYFGSSTGEITGQLIAADTNNKVYAITPFISTGAITDITGTTGSIFANASAIEAPIITGGSPSPQGPIYIASSNNPRFYNGVSGTCGVWNATSGTLPSFCNLAVYFKNRVWMAGDTQTGKKSNLYWSDLGNPRVWPTINVQPINPEDEEPITALGTAGPYLLVFKPSKIFVVFDLDTGAYRPFGRNIGCSAPRSVIDTPIGTFFYSPERREVWITDGKKMNRISDKIRPLLKSVSSGGCSGAYASGHYLLSMSGGFTAPTFTLDYDATTKSWWKHDFACWQFATGPSPDIITAIGNSDVYGCTASASPARVDAIMCPAYTQDQVTNISCQWTGPWLTFGEPYRNKRVRQIFVDGNGTVDGYLAKDYKSGGSSTLVKSDIFSYLSSGAIFGGSGTWGSGTFGDTSATLKGRIYSLGVARAFSFEIRGATSNPFEMDSYTPMITLRQN